MGYREQGNRWRKEERLGTREENHSELGEERRQEGWTCRRVALEILSLSGGPQGRFDSSEIDDSQEHWEQAIHGT